MTTSNHAITGAIIAVAIRQPALVLPLSLMSHFALDALPHFGFPGKLGYPEALKHKKLTLTMESLGVVGLVLFMGTVYGQGWLVWAAAFLAVLPDLYWPYVYWFYERRGLIKKFNPLVQLHHDIQWCERPWGIFVEVGWYISSFLILRQLL